MTVIAPLALSVLVSQAGAPDWLNRSSFMEIKDDWPYVYAVGVVDGIDNQGLAMSTAGNRARAALCQIIGGTKVRWEPAGFSPTNHEITTQANCEPLNWVTIEGNYPDPEHHRWYALARAKLLMKSRVADARISRRRTDTWWNKGGAWAEIIDDRVVVFGVGKSTGVDSLGLARTQAANYATAEICSYLWANYQEVAHTPGEPELAWKSCWINLVMHDDVRQVGATTYALGSVILPTTFAAIDALTPEVVGTVLKSSEAGKPRERERAAWLVGRTKLPGGAPEVLSLGETESSEDLTAAISWTLGQYADEGSRAFAVRLSAQTDPARKAGLLEFAARAHLTFSPTEVQELIKPALLYGLGAADGKTRASFQTLGERLLPAELEPLLLQVVQTNKDPGARKDALTALDARKSSLRAGAIQAAAADSSWTVRLAAAELLGAELAEPIDPLLLKLARDPKPDVRDRVYDAFYRHPELAGVPELFLAGLKDKAVGVHGNSIAGLGKVHTEVAKKALVALLKSTNPEDRAQAVEALAQHSDTDALILPMLDDRYDRTVSLAVAALAKNPKLPGLAKKLAAMLARQRHDGRLNGGAVLAAQIIAASGEVALAASLTKTYLDWIDIAYSNDPMRLAVAKAIGQLDDHFAIEALGKELNGSKPWPGLAGEIAALDTPAAFAVLVPCAMAKNTVSEYCRAAVITSTRALAFPGGTYLALSADSTSAEVRTAAEAAVKAKAEAWGETTSFELTPEQRWDLLAMTYSSDDELAVFALSALALDRDAVSRDRIRQMLVKEVILDRHPDLLRAAGDALQPWDDLAPAIGKLCQVTDESGAKNLGRLLTARFGYGLGYLLVGAYVERMKIPDAKALLWMRELVKSLTPSKALAAELLRDMADPSAPDRQIAAAELALQTPSAPLSAGADLVLAKRTKELEPYLRANVEDRVLPGVHRRACDTKVLCIAPGSK